MSGSAETATVSLIDIARLIDAAPLRAGQMRVFVLCGLIAMVDGFDLQIAGSMAPMLSDVLHIPISSFGWVFAAGFLGIMVGSLVLGEVADRTGRKTMVLIALLIAGLFMCLVPMLAAAGWLDLRSLLACRFVAGLGVGGVMPNVLALTAEYAPKRTRALTINTMYCGVPLGSVAVGLVAALLAPLAGWQAVFEIGGAATLILAVMCAALLPESARYLLLRGAPQARITALLRQVFPQSLPKVLVGDSVFTLDEAATARPSLGSLFADGRALPTVLLWLAMFLNLLMIVFVLSWLPAVMREAGVPMRTGVLLAALFSLGGMAGSVLVGRAIDRLGSTSVLIVTYLLAAAAVAGYGLAGLSIWSLYGVTMVAGAMVIGAQSGITAMAAELYPTAMRSTGLGWALGIGRMGSIVGPSLGGIMLSYNWSVMEIFLAAAAPAVLASVIVGLIGLASPSLATTARRAG